MQSCLEIRGIEEREQQTIKSHYDIRNPYTETHTDATSNGDPLGKGTNHGGHTHWLPDCTRPKSEIIYDNFDTEHGGGLYDIKGRNDIGGRERALNMSMYNKEHKYGADLINTQENVDLGQYQTKG